MLTSMFLASLFDQRAFDQHAFDQYVWRGMLRAAGSLTGVSDWSNWRLVKLANGQTGDWSNRRGRLAGMPDRRA